MTTTASILFLSQIKEKMNKNLHRKLNRPEFAVTQTNKEQRQTRFMALLFYLRNRSSENLSVALCRENEQKRPHMEWKLRFNSRWVPHKVAKIMDHIFGDFFHRFSSLIKEKLRKDPFC